MHEYSIIWFDKYARYSHQSIVSLPGTDAGAVRNYLKNNWTPDNLGIEAAYAVALCVDGAEPVLVVKG